MRGREPANGAPGVAEEEAPAYQRVALFGGIYSNHLALAAAIEDARERKVDAIVCLGDLGAFGPNPDRVFPLLREHRIPVVRGNYDDSIARGLADCQCGYTDPRDNHYARLSYRYTYANTAAENRAWMADFPDELRFRLGDLDVLAFHGSPRRTNEFLWESTTPTHFLDKLAEDHRADILVGTHTGIPWWRRWRAGDPRSDGGHLGDGDHSGNGARRGNGGGHSGDAAHRRDEDDRRLGDQGTPRAYVNAGALGRPANDGRTDVWYAVLEARGRELDVELVPVAYDHEALAEEMRAEELPEEFVETILTGWWTTCLEILPGKERAAGRF